MIYGLALINYAVCVHSIRRLSSAHIARLLAGATGPLDRREISWQISHLMNDVRATLYGASVLVGPTLIGL